MHGKLWKATLGVAVLGTHLATTGSASAAVRIFDGGPDGGGVYTGTDIGVAANYVGDVLPSAATPDTIALDPTQGTPAGPLALTYSSGLSGAVGNPGLTINVTGNEASAVSLDSGASTTSIRLGGTLVSNVGQAIQIDSGAGAFTLGDGAGTFNITMGGAGGTTQTLTNNSSKAATINSDVVLGTGGGSTHTFLFNGSGNWAANNLISNSSGTVTVANGGTGTLTLANANTYSGGTTVSGGGTILLTGNGTTGNTTGTVTVNNGTLDFNGLSRTIGAIAGTGGTIVSNSAANTTLTSGSGNTGGTYAGVIANTNNGSAGVVSYTKSGSGTQILTGANTYTGTTTISGGTLQLGSGGATGSLSASSPIVNNGTLLLARTVTMTPGVDFGTISGTGGVVIGFANSAATPVQVTSSNTLGSGTIGILGNTGGGRLELANGSTLANAITISAKTAVANGAAIENVSGSNTLSGPITLTTGGNFYTIQSDAGLLTLNNAAAISIPNAATSRVVTLQGAGDGVISSPITSAAASGTNVGVGAIAKAGAGTWTLSGSNSYAGGTTITGGKLVAGSATALGTGATSVTGTGSTLEVASGVNTGGLTGLSIAGGNTLSLLGAGSELSLASGTFAVGDATTPVTIDLHNAFNAPASYTLVDGVDGANSLGLYTLAGTSPSDNYALAISGNDLVLTVTAVAPVPEPATLGAMAAAGAMLLRRRRRA